MPYEESYFGNCPICHQTAGCVITRDNVNWMVCDAHRLKWYVGSGLFSTPPSDECAAEPVCARDEEIASYTEIDFGDTWTPAAQVAETLLQQMKENRAG